MASNKSVPRFWGDMTVGARLQWLRSRAGISLSEAGRQAKITKAHLWELEDGRATNPGLKTMLALCRVYDISIQKLVTGLQYSKKGEG
jgi:transcriptional regulator with XRE-family HTH domain